MPFGNCQRKLISNTHAIVLENPKAVFRRLHIQKCERASEHVEDSLDALRLQAQDPNSGVGRRMNADISEIEVERYKDPLLGETGIEQGFIRAPAQALG